MEFEEFLVVHERNRIRGIFIKQFKYKRRHSRDVEIVEQSSDDREHHYDLDGVSMDSYKVVIASIGSVI